MAKKTSSRTTSLRSLLGARLADGMCSQGDILLKALKHFDPAWVVTDTMAEATLASFVVRHPWPLTRDEREDLQFFNYACMQWARWSRPTFTLTKDLCAALLLTDCHGVRGRDLKFPFTSFCLSLPEEAGLYLRDAEGKAWPVTVISAAYGRTLQHEEMTPESGAFADLCGLVRDGGPTGSLAQLRTALRSAHERLRAQVHPWSMLRLFSPAHPGGLTLYRGNVMPRDDDAIEAWLAGPRKTKGRLEVGADEEQVLVMAHRLVTNFALYLNAKGPDGLPAPERQSTLLKREWDQAARIYRMGGEVRLPNHMLEAARAAVLGSKQPVAWRVRSRFVVRGHWRNQRYGQERVLTKRMWIQPFWKGPTTAEALSRIYTTAEGSKKPEAKDERRLS